MEAGGAEGLRRAVWWRMVKAIRGRDTIETQQGGYEARGFFLDFTPPFCLRIGYLSEVLPRRLKG